MHDMQAKRARAGQLREAIASGAAQLRRDAARLVPGAGSAAPVGGNASAPRVSTWALAAAAGVIAGLVAGLRRRGSASRR